jgi:hypothetical protein
MTKKELIKSIQRLVDVISGRHIKLSSCSITYSTETLPVYDSKTLIGWYEGKKKNIIISWEEE